MNSLSSSVIEKFVNVIPTDSHGQDVIYASKTDYKDIVRFLKLYLILFLTNAMKEYDLLFQLMKIKQMLIQ